MVESPFIATSFWRKQPRRFGESDCGVESTRGAPGLGPVGLLNDRLRKRLKCEEIALLRHICGTVLVGELWLRNRRRAAEFNQRQHDLGSALQAGPCRERGLLGFAVHQVNRAEGLFRRNRTYGPLGSRWPLPVCPSTRKKELVSRA